MTLPLIIYNLLAGLFTAGILYFLFRHQDERVVERSILLIIVELSFLLLGGILFPMDGFGRIQLMAWGIFLHFPAYLIGNIAILRHQNKLYTNILIGIFALILVISVDAFLIEPQSLEVSRITLYSEKITEPLTVALLADIQTDSPGSYEERVLDLVKAEDPDLILLAGDYLQIMDPDQYQESVNILNRLITDADLSPLLGSVAVRGNVERNGWEGIFQGLEVILVEETQTFDLGPLAITGVDLLDSENPTLEIPGSEKYHIILGHSPNFSLGEIDGDLLLAGHTHGGQIQLPGIGPIMTLSAVPRSWASGLTEIYPGKFLLVSRGIGLERGHAPRLRFLCHPELIIIDLLPPETD
jgi:predicted MPP superfamily phosphohydrolase